MRVCFLQKHTSVSGLGYRSAKKTTIPFSLWNTREIKGGFRRDYSTEQRFYLNYKMLPLNNPRRPSREAAKDGVLRNVLVINILYVDKFYCSAGYGAVIFFTFLYQTLSEKRFHIGQKRSHKDIRLSPKSIFLHKLPRRNRRRSSISTPTTKSENDKA